MGWFNHQLDESWIGPARLFCFVWPGFLMDNTKLALVKVDHLGKVIHHSLRLQLEHCEEKLQVLLQVDMIRQSGMDWIFGAVFHVDTVDG